MSEISLVTLERGESATVVSLDGGIGFQKRLRSVGLKEGKKIRVVAVHPFGGPVVAETDGRQVTIGRKMAQRVTVSKES